MTARRRTNAELTEATTRKLIRHARREFARKGYNNASVDRVAKAARVTKGAIYYHFGSKAGLFEAVFRDAEREIVERIEARATATNDPLLAVIHGCESFLDIALDETLRQITLVDGPAVLGWNQWRAVDREFGLGSLEEGLEACRQAGIFATLPTDALAHLISGALNEAVFLIAESDTPHDRHAEVKRTVRQLLEALATSDRQHDSQPSLLNEMNQPSPSVG